MYYDLSSTGFLKLIYKIGPFLEIRKKIAPHNFFYTNFPLEGALFSQKSCIRNVILD